MAQVITLAKFPVKQSTVRNGMKFCNGQCQNYLPEEALTKHYAVCKECVKQKQIARYNELKMEREMFG